MADIGGIGSFAGGFAQGFQRSREQRRMRDVMNMEQERAKRQEQRQEQQFDRRMKLGEDQAEQLEFHRRVQEDLQQKQFQLQQRGADLQIADKMMGLLNPQVPKPVRQLMLKKFAPAMGIDPASAEFRDFSTMVGQLDSDTLTGIREAIGVMLPSAKPGAIQGFAAAVMSGKLDLGDVMKMAETARQQRAREQSFGTSQQPVPANRLMSPTPIARQGDAPGGNLPIPGMTQPTKAPNGKTPAQLREGARQLFMNGDMEGGNAALSLARAMEGNIPNTVESIRAKIAGGQQLTPGEQRVYDDALKADPLARLLSGLGAEGGEPATPAPSAPATGPSEEDIQFTMRKHGLTREQVLERLQ
jgi:hypothetical protein